MKYKHIVEIEKCKGCSLCLSVCPKNVLEISKNANSKGYYPVEQIRPKDCVSCTMCCIMCPDVAISIDIAS